MAYPPPHLEQHEYAHQLGGKPITDDAAIYSAMDDVFVKMQTRSPTKRRSQ